MWRSLRPSIHFLATVRPAGRIGHGAGRPLPVWRARSDRAAAYFRAEVVTIPNARRVLGSRVYAKIARLTRKLSDRSVVAWVAATMLKKSNIMLKPLTINRNSHADGSMVQSACTTHAQTQIITPQTSTYQRLKSRTEPAARK